MHDAYPELFGPEEREAPEDANPGFFEREIRDAVAARAPLADLFADAHMFLPGDEYEALLKRLFR